MHPTTPPGEPPDEPSRGRRGNGLTASEWGALVDVDPRLSERLLDHLGAAGVAARVEPAGATTDPVSRAGTMPVRPLDRLSVDVQQADRARAVVDSEARDAVAQLREPGSVDQFLHAVPRGAGGRVLEPPTLLRPRAPEPDTEAAWRAIVEAFELTSDSPVPPWPVSEDLDTSARSEQPPRSRRVAEPERPRVEGDLPAWVEPAALPDNGHFVPPPPPPPPRLRGRTLGAWASLLLGMLVLLTPSLLDVAPGAGTFVIGAALAVGGVAALVHGMRDAPGPDDDPDDGAVV